MHVLLLIQKAFNMLYKLHQHTYTCCECRITLSTAAVQPPRGEMQQLCNNRKQHRRTWQQPEKLKLPYLVEAVGRILGE